MKQTVKEGFTLIGLIIVIAILAFVTVIGIHNYGNVKDVQAKKMNVTNIKRVFNALATYNELREDVYGRFNHFDSLIDAKADGPQDLGTPGTYDWDSLGKAESASGIIYDGHWKAFSGELEIEAAKDRNQGITSELAAKLGVYYLTAGDVESMKKAGIQRYLEHSGRSQLNPTYAPTAESGELCHVWQSGGPAFRPDMSGYLSCPITNGSPVCVIRPDAKCESVAGYVYNHLGYSLTNDYSHVTTSADMTNALNGKTRLIVFGIGRGAECVTSQLGLGEVPYDPVYNKTYYRNYLAVFALYTGSRGTASTCRLVGVLDAKGNTWEGASYGLKWQTTEN